MIIKKWNNITQNRIVVGAGTNEWIMNNSCFYKVHWLTMNLELMTMRLGLDRMLGMYNTIWYCLPIWSLIVYKLYVLHHC